MNPVPEQSTTSEHCLLTVIVPVLNEADFIASSMESIVSSAAGMDVEVLVIDGGSTDGTLQIIDQIRHRYPFVRTIPNPKVKQVFGLNIGIREARGKYIVRCDAHSVYPTSYFRTFVDFFQSSQGRFGNIGVAYETANSADGLRRGIAEAMSSRLGVGGSHRTSQPLTAPQEVDTVLFGAWPAAVFSEVGEFDERFVRGQDYEHNLRLRKAGWTVAQIPGETFTYFTRSTFAKLARMISQYAYVKGQLLAMTGRPTNLRSMAPVVLLLTALASAPFPRILLGGAALYVAIVVSVATLHAARNRQIETAIGMGLAIPLMHVSHALGFIAGFLRTASGASQGAMESTR